jgi:hypothetical protein
MEEPNSIQPSPQKNVQKQPVELNVYQPTTPLRLRMGEKNIFVPVPNGDFRLFSHQVLMGDGKRQRENRYLIFNVLRAVYLKGLEDGRAAN